MPNSMYYDVNDALSYNRLFTFVVSGRGYGKSFSAKKRCLKNFLSKGEQFVILRRYKSEHKKADQYFNDVVQKCPEFEGVEIKYNKGQYLINKKVAGYAMSLSTQVIEKSIPYPDVTLIVFEEFLIQNRGTGYHYIRDEVEVFLETYSTIARDRDVRVLFLANAITMYNPYFIYFNLYLKPDATKCRNGDVILLKVAGEEFTQHMEQTRYGKIIAGTRYGQYAIGNEPLQDDNTFLEKKTDNCSYYLTFLSDGEQYGVWQDDKTAVLYVSQDVDPYCRKKFVFSASDHKPNLILLKSISSDLSWRFCALMYKAGNMRFEDGRSKAAWLNIMSMVHEVRV